MRRQVLLLLALASGTGDVSAVTPLRVGVVLSGPGPQVLAIMRGASARESKAFAGDAPIDFLWRWPTVEGDRAEQSRLVDALTAEKVDVIFLLPIDRKVLAAPVENAMRHGLSVVLLGGGVDTSAEVLRISPDYHQEGRLAARQLGKMLEGKGRVILLRKQIAASAAEQREEGFFEVMQRDFPGIQLVATDYHAGPTPESARKVVQSLFSRYGKNIDGIFASSESGTLGLLAALQDAGSRPEKIKVVGVDEGDGALFPLWKARDLQGFIAENLSAITEAGVRAVATRHIAGDRPVSIVTEFVFNGGANDIASFETGSGVAIPPAWPKISADVCPEKFPRAPASDRNFPVSFAIPELGLTMIAVPAGNFRWDEGLTGDAVNPGRSIRVTLSQPFWLGKYEVTQQQWTAVMGGNPSDFQAPCLPAENISWNDATEFCRRLTAREAKAGRLPAGYFYMLPTEAQWEYACRAGTAGDQDEINQVAWCMSNSGAGQAGQQGWRMTTHPVGQKRANAWGFYDMLGNVAEWCADRFGPYPMQDATDPVGAITGNYHVLRGGAWWTDPQNCGASKRQKAPAERWHSALGLRVVLSQDQSISPLADRLPK